MSDSINQLLNDKLFQVIGSTPKSIAEALIKIDLKSKKNEGAQIFAVAIFASAVNKATLETFLADSRFSTVRPLINAAMSIQGRANMTALTLLGHCLMTTSLASNVSFSSEFRKKMGQEHLWAGELAAGSLSEKQKGILKEKKRLTDEASAKALGSGFLKLTGLLNEPMNRAEADLFNTQIQSDSSAASGGGQALGSSGERSGYDSSAADRQSPTLVPVSSVTTASMPDDVVNYRRDIIGQSDTEMVESYNRKGEAKFIADTRKMIADDPDGSRAKGASTIGQNRGR